AHPVPLRQLSGRGGAVAAAVRAQGGSARAGAGPDPFVSLRARLSRVRGADPGQQRGGGEVGQGGGCAGAGTTGRSGLSVLAKRLAGLRQQAGAAVPRTAAPVAPFASPRGATTDGSLAPPAALCGATTDRSVALPAAVRSRTREQMAPAALGGQ